MIAIAYSVSSSRGWSPVKQSAQYFPGKIHKRESEPLDRTVTIKRSKHSDRVCNSSKGDVEVVAYTKLSRGSSVVERWTHNPEVDGAIPSPATKVYAELAQLVEQRTCNA